MHDRRFLIALLLLIALPAWAALSDPAALKRALNTWGPQGRIGTVRGANDTNWTKLVGFRSEGCEQPFTTVGSGFNTWDAAFADADAHPYPIAGPFAGQLNLQARAWDQIGIASIKFHVDSVGQAQVFIAPGTTDFTLTRPIDTTTLPDGIHVFCAQVFNVNDFTGRSARPTLFRTLQATGTANATLPAGALPNSIPDAYQLQVFQ